MQMLGIHHNQNIRFAACRMVRSPFLTSWIKQMARMINLPLWIIWAKSIPNFYASEKIFEPPESRHQRAFPATRPALPGGNAHRGSRAGRELPPHSYPFQCGLHGPPLAQLNLHFRHDLGLNITVKIAVLLPQSLSQRVRHREWQPRDHKQGNHISWKIHPFPAGTACKQPHWAIA